MARGELPPPVHILLAYAADGWAAENGQFNPSGKPKPPDMAAWLPVARALLQESDGLNRLRDLALTGMAAWNVDPSIIACVAPAFATPDFAMRLARRLAITGNWGPDPAPIEEPAPSPRTISEPAPPANPSAPARRPKP
jgi:hypothetical protein